MHYKEPPGGHGTDAEDIVVLNGLVHQALQPITGDSRFDPEEIDEILLEADKIGSEFVRAAGGELHNISALTGGMVAQEAIKLITRQYVPVNNTCVFDGIKSTTSVLRI
jgi:amyloid beta precursor protein binding protein 1